ncbi:hypothetical protein [Paraburkholderia sp. A3RO-2L]|jgi:hypothetical protein|uniref:hypothetical protein n=1 Tax=unclassified Paraburkholderia TaxID=2615204 RepID=UPI003DA9D1FF
MQLQLIRSGGGLSTAATSRKKAPLKQVFFPAQDLYFNVYAAPRPEAPNWVQVLCELDDGTESICTYLSPFDAMLDAVFSTKPQKRYYPIPADTFDPTVFIADNNGYLRLGLHLGWPARDGKVIARFNGRPASFAIAEEKLAQSEKSERVEFAFSQSMLDCVDRLYESAGLEGYRNAFKTVTAWPEHQQATAVARAVQQLGELADAGTEFNQCALYDPDSMQWHFVSTEPVFTLHRLINGGNE